MNYLLKFQIYQNCGKLNDLVWISGRVLFFASRFEIDDQEEVDVLNVVLFQQTWNDFNK